MPGGIRGPFQFQLTSLRSCRSVRSRCAFLRRPRGVALLRVSLAIAFRWAWIQANPVRCAIRLGLDPREAMWWLFAPPRAVAVQSPLHPRSSLPIPRSCERAGGVIQERLHSGALDAELLARDPLTKGQRVLRVTDPSQDYWRTGLRCTQ